jgi:peptidoglycan/LPS O-acetylase OafA/YrhL
VTAPAPTRPRVRTVPARHRPDDAAAAVADARQLPHLPSLDGLRAVSVLAVMAYHLEVGWARGGFLGVDTFFVLSGFLITTLLVLEFRRAGTIALPAFWIRRIRRLVPAVLLVLLFVAAYNHLAVATWDRWRIRGDALSTLLYVANWRFVVEQASYFELFGAASPLRHMWSLAIEEQFYLAWPVLTLLCLRAGRGSLRTLALVCVAGTVASAAMMAATYDANDPSRAYYGTDSRAHALLVGALLALFLRVPRSQATRRKRARARYGSVAFVAIVASWVTVSATSAGYYRGGSLLYALAVAVVIGGAVEEGPLRTALSRPTLAWIGRISYGLYLWHWPIYVWLVPSRVHVDGVALDALRVMTTFAAATASYYLVERPIRLRRVPDLRAVTVFATTAVAVVLVGAVSFASAARATAPPSYLRAFGHPSPCRGPAAGEQRTALAAAGRERVPDPAFGRLVLVGDSIGCSLFTGLWATGRVAGFDAAQASIVGCGVVSDEIVPTRGQGTMRGTDRCHDLVRFAVSGTIARTDPDVVVWLSAWERMSLRAGGDTFTAGTREADRLLLDRMERAYERMTEQGARLVMLTVPPSSPGSALGTRFAVSEERDAQTLHLNELLTTFATRHPGTVRLVDLAAHVCPNGTPCRPTVDGFRPRPDGTHFSPAGAAWAAAWVVGQLSAPSDRPGPR